ncbi:DUF862-domain-containing protein [Gonapodya prolifera JEL478]|uniref:DUF862-domain-containing protein n=1 Tax=Gonapodya prolifera (strain JEL478) TaxID=1344416 RepID=A0A139AL16_GONPJ|nr:DUF862-domain-containing protein [Gonapodya prolifera JEL478]|eukprot:KXS17388.1 DUF862-domain-containing protein [Gonapodya prolifera JEL478]
MSEESSPVLLYVYDLSQGMARLMSMQLTGRQIDAIYHTSVVAFGREYFFGAGIMSTLPGQSHHGTPIEILPMGYTQLPREVFFEYLQEMRSVYTADKYHLLDNNCNNFTNEVCQFLVGRTIPSHITGLPNEFLQTPLGKQLLPMIEGMFGRSRYNGEQAPASGIAPAPPAPSPPNLPLSSASPSAPLQITSLAQLNSTLTSHKLVVAFFTRDGCAPCKAIAPEFDNIVRTANSSYTQIGRPKTARSGSTQFVHPVIVHASNAPTLPSHFSITGFPTFTFFVDGKRDEGATVLGADRARLKSTIEHLISTSYPPHPHALVTLRGVDGRPATFGVGQDLSKVLAKLKEVVAATGPVEPEAWQTIERVAVELSRKPENLSTVTPINAVSAFRSLWTRLVSSNPDSVFPLLDLLRLCVLNSTLRGPFTNQEADVGRLVMEVIERCTKVETNGKAMGKAGRVMVIRMAANLFAFPDSAKLALSTTSVLPGTPSSYRTLTTSLLVESLLSSDTIVRQTASSLALNISLAISSSYSGSGVDILGGGSVFSPVDGIHERISDDDDSWLVEMASAVARAAEEERDAEVLLRLAAALASIARFAPEGVTGLFGAVEIVDRLKERSKELSSKGDAKADTTSRIVGYVDGLEKLLGTI